MKTFTKQEVDEVMNRINPHWLPPGHAIEDDGRGQIILYTGIFKWNDGTFRDEPQDES